MSSISYNDKEAAQSLVKIIGESRWEAVCLAGGYLEMLSGRDDKIAARIIFDCGNQTLKRSTDFIKKSKESGFIKNLKTREKMGSAENPITKLFPAVVTEQRFLEILDDMCSKNKRLKYSDDRKSSHGLTDFTIYQNKFKLPINIKNAGTRFEQSKKLVGLNPEDCIPIPAYKAHAALKLVSDLIYVVSVDYDLVNKIEKFLPKILTRDEMIVWDLLNKYSGSLVRDGEDYFIFGMVKKYWKKIREIIDDKPFYVISARKSIKILRDRPERTPGIGLRAWGTGANAEVNVHISISEDMVKWSDIQSRIMRWGISDIIKSINKESKEIVYNPDI